MKKKILGAVAVIAIAAIATFNMNIKVEKKAFSNLSLYNLEALAFSETNCTSTSGTNTGTCKAKVGGGGDACVEPGFWDTKNCYK